MNNWYYLVAGALVLWFVRKNSNDKDRVKI